MPRSSDVVVTGVGPVTAVGIGAESYWQSLSRSQTAIGSLQRRTDKGPKPAPHWRSLPLPGAWLGAPIVDFVGEDFVRPRKALKVMSRELQTAFAASTLAMDECGLGERVRQGELAPERVATVFGSEMLYGPSSELHDAMERSRDERGEYQLNRFGDAAMRNIMPLWMLKYLPNMPACHVGISIGALGANNTILAGDVSITSALIEAVSVLRRGIADVVICGGSGTMIDSTRLVYRGDLPVPEVVDPLENSCRPHATEAVGVVGGEAAGAMVLEFAAAAERRGVKPLAVVAGGVSRFYAPECGQRGSAEAIANAITGALEQAGLTPESIGLVVSHGMGDPLRDAAERHAIERTVPAAPLVMPIASVGHCGAGTAAIHLITGVLALTHRQVPPSQFRGTAPCGWESRFRSTPTPLTKDAVLVLAHTSQGVANAVVLRSA